MEKDPFAQHLLIIVFLWIVSEDAEDDLQNNRHVLFMIMSNEDWKNVVILSMNFRLGFRSES